MTEQPAGAPDLPALPALLRLWLGHLLPPGRMREFPLQHRDFAERERTRALEEAAGSASRPEWAYPQMVLRWSAQRYEAERDEHAARHRPDPPGA